VSATGVQMKRSLKEQACHDVPEQRTVQQEQVCVCVCVCVCV